MTRTVLESQNEIIYQKIRERICLLQYEPGELLSENALASEFGVSRTPMRRILRQLEFEGLVTTKQGVGTLVATLDLRLLREVYALRIKLAELIGDLTSPPPVDVDLTVFEQLLARCAAVRDSRDPQELARINMEFNDALMKCINNQPLLEISNRLYYQTARVWPQILPDLNWLEELDSMQDEIEKIAAALKQGDMQRVGQVRRDHIAQSLSRIQRYLGEGSY